MALAVNHLARALAYHRQRANVAPGAAQARLRNLIIIGPVAPDLMADAKAEAKRLMSMTQADMPASPDDLALLIDTIAMRYGKTSRAEAWRFIGIKPGRGRDLFARNANAIDWPIFYTARTYALGGA